MIGVATWIGVAACGALGALARFRVDGSVTARTATVFPIGTFVVNLTGAFVLGALMGLDPTHRVGLLFGTGFLGGYTTFSTWMVESERLVEGGDLPFVLLNLGASMAFGFGVAAGGWYVGQAIA
jgi:CrcB protein